MCCVECNERLFAACFAYFPARITTSPAATLTESVQQTVPCAAPLAPRPIVTRAAACSLIDSFLYYFSHNVWNGTRKPEQRTWTVLQTRISIAGATV